MKTIRSRGEIYFNTKETPTIEPFNPKPDTKISELMYNGIIEIYDGLMDIDITLENCPDGKLGELYFDVVSRAYSCTVLNGLNANDSNNSSYTFDIFDYMNINRVYRRHGVQLDFYYGDFKDIAKNLICYHPTYTVDDTLFFACFNNEPNKVFIINIDVDEDGIPYDCYGNTRCDMEDK